MSYFLSLENKAEILTSQWNGLGKSRFFFPPEIE